MKIDQIEWKKSRLELRMEKQGWRLLTNISGELDIEGAQTLAKIREKYGQIRVFENAYDSEGNPLLYMKAVYIPK